MVMCTQKDMREVQSKVVEQKGKGKGKQKGKGKGKDGKFDANHPPGKQGSSGSAASQQQQQQPSYTGAPAASAATPSLPPQGPTPESSPLHAIIGQAAQHSSQEIAPTQVVSG